MPEPENSAAPIIIIKKKQHHAGHHGGAWKVAYADFVTAMMALFIVLWLLSTSEKVQKAVASYFKDPTGNGKLMGSAMAGLGESVNVTKDDMGQLKEKLEQAMKTIPQFQQMKDNVELTITNEGLRVELLETEKGMFFDSGNAHPTSRGEELLVRLAAELGKLPNSLLMEGHTDAKPYTGAAAYSNWELSADRANSARRLMQSNGLRPAQVAQVRGYADQRLRTPQDPMNPSNRRISVIVQYLNATQSPATWTHSRSGAGQRRPSTTNRGQTGKRASTASAIRPANQRCRTATGQGSALAARLRLDEPTPGSAAFGVEPGIVLSRATFPAAGGSACATSGNSPESR